VELYLVAFCVCTQYLTQSTSSRRISKNMAAQTASALEAHLKAVGEWQGLQGALQSYKELFALLCEHGGKDELQSALIASDGYAKLHEASLRDAKRGLETSAPELCEHAIKILSWVWYRHNNNLSKQRKEEAVDALIELFFACETRTEKSLATVAQHSVWALANIGGAFPHERGRIKRAIEVAALSCFPNVFQSERIGRESARLLKTLVSPANIHHTNVHIADWVVPVVRILCHKVTKTSEVALDAVFAIAPVLWSHRSDIGAKLASDEQTWQAVSAACQVCLIEPVGSKRRQLVAKVMGRKCL